MTFLFLNYTKKKISKARLKKTLNKLSQEFGSHRTFKKKRSLFPGIEDLSLVFVGRAKSKWVNLKFRKKNYATDVLSFPAQENAMGLGELVFCVPVLEKQALEHSWGFEKELNLMLIHGFLHLLGYDHEKSLKDERQMMKIQERLFKKINK